MSYDIYLKKNLTKLIYFNKHILKQQFYIRVFIRKQWVGKLKSKENTKSFFESLFLHEKPVKMLISLKNDRSKYTTQVSKDVDCTYSHTVKVLNMFKKMGLVSFDKKGRIKHVKLTRDGDELALAFEGIMKNFTRLAGQIKEDLSVKKETKVKEKKTKK